jgi:hypothetical protein
MQTVKLTHDWLCNLIANEILKTARANGNANVSVTSIVGVVGKETFVLDGVEVTVGKPQRGQAAVQAQGKKFTAPAGAGKIKLVAVDGVAVS